MKRRLAALGVLCLVGCKSATPSHVTQAAAPHLASGWASAASRDGKVSVGVPPNWRAGVDRMVEGLSDILQGGDTSQAGQYVADMATDMKREADENERKALEELEKKGIVVHVINGTKPTPGEARTRFYVQWTDGEGVATWDEAKAVERKWFLHVPVPKEVQLPIGKALRFWETTELRDGGVLHKISYVVLEGKAVYSLRFVTEESKDAIASVEEGVAQSWRIKV